MFDLWNSTICYFWTSLQIINYKYTPVLGTLLVKLETISRMLYIFKNNFPQDVVKYGQRVFGIKFEKNKNGSTLITDNSEKYMLINIGYRGYFIIYWKVSAIAKILESLEKNCYEIFKRGSLIMPTLMSNYYLIKIIARNVVSSRELRRIAGPQEERKIERNTEKRKIS